MRSFWNAALAHGTVNLYKAAYSSFKQFLEQYSLWTTASGTPPVVNEDILMYFVTYCASKGLRYNTIKQYLAGIRHYYIAYNVQTPLSCSATLHRLRTLLRGVKKSQDNSSRVRLPVTYPILLRILTSLNNGIMGTYNGLMLSAACSMAFSGFLRCGEFTILGNESNPDYCLCIEDIEFSVNNHYYVLKLKSSKTDVFKCGIGIPIYASFKRFCPLKLMKEYIDLRLRSGAVISDPLFITQEGLVLSRMFFLLKV